jgi:hypothetical protein
MNKPLTIGFAGLAVAAAVTLVAARSPSRAPAADTAGALMPSLSMSEAQAAENPSATPEHVAIVVFEPHYGSSPRIIHVPQPPERSRASANDRNEAAATVDDDEVTPPPPSRYRVIPLPQRRSNVPPPAVPPRAVLSAPPQPAGELTPIHPTPRYNSKADAAEKLAAPNTVPATASLPPPPPPVGYTPPSGLPDRR